MQRLYTGLSRSAVSVEQRDGQPKRILGYGAVFYNGEPETQYELWPGVVERIMPGAFDKVLSDDVRGLFNHDPTLILGRTAAGTMTLETDSRGIKYTIDPPDTQVGRDLLFSIGRGDITGSSFSFDLGEGDEDWATEEIRGVTVTVRYLRGFRRLYDVGPVSFPAYTGTTAGTRAESDSTDLRAAVLAAQERLRRDVDAESRRRRRVRADWIARELGANTDA